MHNFLDQYVPMFPLYILLIRRVIAFWSKDFDKFCSGGIETVWVQKIMQGKVTKLPSLHT